MMPSARFKVRTAVQNDVPYLRLNWSVSFGDTDEYLDFFFSRRFIPDNTLVALAGEKVVSQLFLLPATLRTQEDEMPVDYLFAAATHPDYRGQGVMSLLLDEARTICRQRGIDAIVLLPGNETLYGYYEKHGYETAFSRRRWNATREELSHLAAPIEKNADAVSVLQTILSRRNGLCWDGEALAYALAEHDAFRGKYASSDHAFVSVSDDEAFCLSDAENFGECAALLLGLSDLPSFSLILPADIPFGTPEDGGMLCRLSDKPIHLRDAFISFAME